MHLSFDIYGLEIEAVLHSKQMENRLKNDFSYFLSNHQTLRPFITVECIEKGFDHTSLPQTAPFIQNSNVIAFKAGDKKYYNYHYEGLVIEDLQSMHTTICSSDIDRLHELTYLYILSKTGKELDFRGMHKIHGMALAYDKLNVLFLAPSKGGKSTIFLQLLENLKDVRFYSDDTPLLSHDGIIHPFPLRIGLNNNIDSYSYLHHNKIYSLQRKIFGEKLLIAVDEIERKIASTNSNPNIVLVGKRANQKYIHFIPLTFFSSFTYLMEFLVVGIGLPMIAEFFVSHSLRDYPEGLKILLSRMKSAYALTRNARFYEVLLSENPIKNAKEIEHFIKQLSK